MCVWHVSSTLSQCLFLSLSPSEAFIDRFSSNKVIFSDCPGCLLRTEKLAQSENLWPGGKTENRSRLQGLLLPLTSWSKSKKIVFPPRCNYNVPFSLVSELLSSKFSCVFPQFSIILFRFYNILPFIELQLRTSVSGPASPWRQVGQVWAVLTEQ